MNEAAKARSPKGSAGLALFVQPLAGVERAALTAFPFFMEQAMVSDNPTNLFIEYEVLRLLADELKFQTVLISKRMSEIEARLPECYRHPDDGPPCGHN